MGKKLIIKGADFSANGIPTIVTELIYDSITGFTDLSGWNSENTAAVSTPTNANIAGRNITSIVLKRYSKSTATKPIAIAEYNTQSGTYTVLATIPVATFNANIYTEVSLGTGVRIGSNELLMIGAPTLSSGGMGMFFSVATGNESTNFGKYNLTKDGVFGGPSYGNAPMCKIYAEVE